jgi:hypothetical protein
MSEERTVRVLIYRVARLQPELVRIPATLKAQQEIVGGLIQPLNIEDNERGMLSVVVNEEGLIMGLPFNRRVRISDQFITDLYGDYYIARWNAEGEIVDLTDSDLLAVLGPSHWSAL